MTAVSAKGRYRAASHSTYSYFGAGALPQAMGELVETLFAWRERARERRQLQTMSDRLLNDIGLTRADTERETNKPFWRE